MINDASSSASLGRTPQFSSHGVRQREVNWRCSRNEVFLEETWTRAKLSNVPERYFGR